MFIWQQLSVVEGVPPLPPRPPISTTGTLLLYRFAGNTNKEGSWASTPTQSGGPITFPVDSPFGNQSALFTNNAVIARDTSGPFSGTGAYTIGGWIKPTAMDGVSTIMQQRGSGNNGQFAVYINAVNSSMGHYDGTNVTIRPLVVPNVVEVGVWVHWAVVRQGNITRMYINGEEAGVLTNTSAANILPTNGFCLGFDQRDRRQYYTGHMRDMFVCNRAFTVEEVEYLGKHKLPYPAL